MAKSNSHDDVVKQLLLADDFGAVAGQHTPPASHLQPPLQWPRFQQSTPSGQG